MSLSINIPALGSSVDPNVVRAFEAVKKALIGLDTAVGLANKSAASAVQQVGSLTGSGGGSTAGLPYSPYAPTGFEVTGAYSTIILAWNPPLYNGHQLTQIYRSETNVIGTATLIGTSGGSMFVDKPTEGQYGVTFYYWIRFVGTTGTGPWNGIEGTSGATALSPAYILQSLKNKLGYAEFGPGSYPVRVVDALPALPDALFPPTSLVYFDNQLYRQANGVWTNAIPAATVTGQLTSGQIATDAITSAKIAAHAITVGKIAAGAIVAGDGVIGNAAIASAAIIDGAITTAKIGLAAVDTARIADAAIHTAKIEDAAITGAKIAGTISSLTQTTTRGWTIRQDGTVECKSIYARGDIEASSIKAGTANIISSLMLQDQAVTFPEQVVGTPTDIPMTDPATWGTAASIDIDMSSGAYATLILLNLDATLSTQTECSDLLLLFKVVREARATPSGTVVSSTDIGEVVGLTNGGALGTGSPRTALVNSRPAFMIDANPPALYLRYKLQCRHSYFNVLPDFTPANIATTQNIRMAVMGAAGIRK